MRLSLGGGRTLVGTSAGYIYELITTSTGFDYSQINTSARQCLGDLRWLCLEINRSLYFVPVDHELVLYETIVFTLPALLVVHEILHLWLWNSRKDAHFEYHLVGEVRRDGHDWTKIQSADDTAYDEIDGSTHLPQTLQKNLLNGRPEPV